MRKNKKNNLATKRDLEILEIMIEKKFDKKLMKIKGGLIFYIDERLKPLQESIQRSEKIWQNVSKTLDWLVGKFTKFDQELTILTGRYPEINDKLENHEKRIGVLEKKTSYS